MHAPGTCASCSSPLPAGNLYCGSCGQPVSPPSALPTQRLAPGAGPAARRATGAEARFLPGMILAERYRMVGMLGRGGMGEVYRADDLKLGQPVALKFLPPGFETRPDRLQRFLNEVRTARQIAHTNVCRIYDAGEADRQHFISMEYVDGEDLASLLRRIGHIPRDKAIEVARQICAGLAAAHEIGVLHRDLKPANIMIDGRGRARITDFGLAAFAQEVAGEEVRSGTPAYMAPEQLAGREVSVRSDLYALGLVLYELFTGRPAFDAATVDDLRRLHSETTPSSPSSFVEGFDPTVERVILRCLETDPARRPSSAHAIAAALPGGDPLAAALAAGETPSPEMVAEAAGTEAVPPAVSWGALAVFIVCLAGVIALAPRSALVGMVALDKPPEFLQERAREILEQAGHNQKRADSLFAFRSNRSYLNSLSSHDGAVGGRWDNLGLSPPAGILFWYRESPQELSPVDGAAIGAWLNDPPDSLPGMARVGLDPDGHLMSLLIVPGERTPEQPAPGDPDWGPLLAATGVDAKSLSPAEPEWAPPVFADRRVAWTGLWPGPPGTQIRIEAAAAGGKPVSLRVIEPWTRPAEQPTPPGGFWSAAGRFVGAAWPLIVLIVAGTAALRNVRRGRGDRRGALRLALCLGALRMMLFFGAHHLASPTETILFIEHLASATLHAGFAYVFYLAVEPYARRLWPRVLVSWVRVLEGRFRDPLVGRDLLVGCATGALAALIGRLGVWLPLALDWPQALPSWSLWTFEPLRGTVPAMVSVAALCSENLLEIIFPITTLLIFRLLLRRNWLAIVAATLMGIVVLFPDSGSIPAYLVRMVLWITPLWLVLFRCGMLGFGATFLVGGLASQLPLTLHPSAWLLGPMLLSLACIVAPALYGFWISMAGRPLFRDEVLDPARR